MADGLDELKASNSQRLTRLAQQGTAVQGLGEAYTRRPLEHLVGDAIDLVQTHHELWVAEQLDGIEQKAARDRLAIGRPLGPGGIGH